MILYVAGPMTGIPELNTPAFDKAAFDLEECGYTVQNPAELVVDGWTWAQYLRYDLPLMLRCEGVATLDGWDQSKGAQLEVHVATQLGMPVRSVAEWLEQA